MLDERGFLFTLPRLGCPDPRVCEAVLVNAAIGTKAAALDALLNNSSSTTALQTLPLRREGTYAFAETGMVDLECRGSLWALPLLKPRSSAEAGAAPQLECFSIKVKRLHPSFAPDATRCKLPDDSDWVWFPMAAYEGQLAARSSASSSNMAGAQGQQQRRFFAIDAGTAAQAKVKARAHREAEPQQQQQKREEDEEITEMKEAVMTSEMFNKSWLHSLKLSTMLHEANTGNPLAAVHDTQRLKLRLRIHPAANDDYKSIDYVVRRQDEDETLPVAEGRWKTLPVEATKSGAQRLYVNLHRERVGKRGFERGERPPKGEA